MLNIARIKTATVNIGIADSVGKKKDGTFVVRRGYFYRNGMDGQKFRDAIVKSLSLHGLGDVEVVDYGDHWAPFRGGASVAQSSHFYVTIR